MISSRANEELSLSEDHSFIHHWPIDAANNVLFPIPESWKSVYDEDNYEVTDDDQNNYYTRKFTSSRQYCKLHYDPIQRYVNVVSADNPDHTFDIIDADDMIGANIIHDSESHCCDDEEIQRSCLNVINKSFKRNDDLYSNEVVPADYNQSKNQKQHDETIVYSTNDIADSPKSYLGIKNKINRSLLSIYVYPRRRLPDRGWLLRSRRTVSNDSIQPQPSYIRLPKQQQDEQTMGPDLRFGNRFPNHRAFRLVPSDDESMTTKYVNMIVAALRCIARTSGHDTIINSKSISTVIRNLSTKEYERFLIIVNPQSGPKQNGVQVCEETVVPMLHQAGVDTDVIVTTHPRHATELCTGRIKDCEFSATTCSCENSGIGFDDISKYDALVLIGGDGIVHEVLNGIRERNDSDTILNKLPIGVVGCGSGNGLVSSLLYASQERFGIIDATFLIAKRQTTAIDTSKYEVLDVSTSQSQDNKATAKETKIFAPNIRRYSSFLSFAWGFISDVDLESECIRWFGARRFDVWSAWRVINLRTYKATFSYRPVVREKQDSTINGACDEMIPAITDPVPSDWKVVEDNIILFWVSHLTHTGTHIFNSPLSKLQDGVFQIMIIRSSVSLVRLSLILLHIERGGHIGMSGCEFIECTAFRLEPDLTNRNYTRNDLDGEIIADGIIQASVQPASMHVFCHPMDE